MSDLHLGIQKKGGTLVVTNLDSTDGTLINEKRLRPGAALYLPSPKWQSLETLLPVLQFPAGTTNPPHTHPRSAELLFLVDGSLRVGFVDTTNKLFTQTLQAGDMFVFPKGLVHFQYNADARNQALAISAFESAGAGTVSLPTTLFTTSIDDYILAKPFKIDVATIQALKAGSCT
ncbi:GERMIN-LIKE PROTEIN [Salix koriyanagi]|uniref:Germin-like protein n=1 Tax=Salix koriyanagi TaxID=2511006 RepID=A0A9Q0ZM20_9ROSI|nr:GERMIN-LIKE PROTEIN [Salix koriyanagi]